MSGFESLKFFATAPHPCSYLADQEATTLFVTPDTTVSDAELIALTEKGFRRSGRYIYRPHCDQCSACISVRIPVAAFSLKRRHRRCVQSNLEVVTTVGQPVLDARHYGLYDRYIRMRHHDGDMHPPTSSQYAAFLTSGGSHSGFLDATFDQTLIATMLFDRIGQHGLSAVYTFYDPDAAFANRSLGRLMVLRLIELAQQSGIPYVYLGYWIRDCQKMAYKTEYSPLERLVNGRWIQTD